MTCQMSASFGRCNLGWRLYCCILLRERRIRAGMKNSGSSSNCAVMSLRRSERRGSSACWILCWHFTTNQRGGYRATSWQSVPVF
ncbi:unnamed protein product [Ectocarpus sp. 4 AP-2014]